MSTGRDALGNAHLKMQEQDKQAAFFFYKVCLNHFLSARKQLQRLHEQDANKQRYSIMMKSFDDQIIQHMEVAEQLQVELGLRRPDPSRAHIKSDTERELDASQRSPDNSLFKRPNRIVRWADIGGLHLAVQTLKETVQYPRESPQMFTFVKPDRVILLYGPPGTGKTFLAQAVATELDAPFASVTATDVNDKYLGESEKGMRRLFEDAIAQQPCVLFLDEIDGIASTRSDGEQAHARNVKNELLVQLQNLLDSDHKVTILMATNMPEQLDPALRRRIQKRIFIGLPDEAARRHMLEMQVKQDPTALVSSNEIDELAVLTDGYSGSDIRMLGTSAGQHALRQSRNGTHFKRTLDGKNWVRCAVNDEKAQQLSIEVIKREVVTEPLTGDHFKEALHDCKASCNASQARAYDEWTNQYGMQG